MKKSRKELTDEEIEKGCADFAKLVHEGKVPKFIMDEVNRELYKILGINPIDIEPIDPDKIQ